MTPQAPNPYQTAAAQTGSNIDSTIASGLVNNMDQSSPFGSVKYTPNGTRSFTDSTGKTVSIPSYSSTTTFSPDQQALYDRQVEAGKNLGDLAVSQSDKLGTLLNTPFSTANAPAAGNPASVTGGQVATGYDHGGPLQTQIAPAGDIQGSVSDHSLDRQAVQDALMGRLNPQLDRQQSQLETKLVNQGLTPGSEAYNEAEAQFGRNRNDAQLAVIAQGGQEQQLLQNLDLNAGNFANSAQQQKYNQNANSAQFGNTAQQQQNAENLAAANFGNTAQQQRFEQANTGFGNQNTARTQALNEAYAARNQPINEIAALLSGGQVTAPQFSSPYQQGIPAAPIGQYINDAYQQNLNSYNSNMSGLFGLGSSLLQGGLMLSDRRAKTDIHRIGKTDGGLPIYRYRYKGGDTPQIGVMAQDVEKKRPEAVAHLPSGLMAVDYAMVA